MNFLIDIYFGIQTMSLKLQIIWNLPGQYLPPGGRCPAGADEERRNGLTLYAVRKKGTI